METESENTQVKVWRPYFMFLLVADSGSCTRPAKKEKEIKQHTGREKVQFLGTMNTEGVLHARHTKADIHSRFHGYMTTLVTVLVYPLCSVYFFFERRVVGPKTQKHSFSGQLTSTMLRRLDFCEVSINVSELLKLTSCAFLV